MNRFLVVLGILLVAGVSARLSFKYTDCNNSPNKIVHFENGHLSADPVMIPGNETGDVDVHILQNISGNHYQLNVTIHKGTLQLLCHESSDGRTRFGSCSYDLCDLLGSGRIYSYNVNHCPYEIATTSPDFPCTCPFPEGTYHLNPSTFSLPPLEGIWKILGRGDYTVNATIHDTDTGEQVACYNLEVSIETDCTGLLCIFG